MFNLLIVLKYLLIVLVFIRTFLKEPISFLLAVTMGVILISSLWRAIYRSETINIITLLLDLVLAFAFSLFAKSGQYDKLFMICLAEGTAILPKPFFVFYAVFAFASSIGVIGFHNFQETGRFYFSFFESLLYVLVFVLVWSERRQREQKMVYEKLTKELRYVNFQLQESLSLNERLASEAERQQLAGEIHDSLGYHLTGLLLTLEAGKKLMNHDLQTARTYWDKGIEIARVAIGSVRKVVSEKKEANFEFGLIDNLMEMADEVKSLTGLTVTLDIKTQDIGLSGKEQLTIYRIFQEAVTNTLRHANASRACIIISGDPECLNFIYEDNGVGTKQIEKGNGLKGMRDRISDIGGSIDFYSYPEKGFKIEAYIHKRRKES